MKPELTGLSVLTTMCAYYLGNTGEFHYGAILSAAVGTLLVGGGAGTLNQYVERSRDSLMKRTERRPLPSGRIEPSTALVFGIVLSSCGLWLLAAKANLLSSGIALCTLLAYLFIYTPMKSVSSNNTIVGAVPGALPVLIGWAAATNSISLHAMAIFLLLFFWQIPHFLALGWMYRKDYARAGIKILPVIDVSGIKSAGQMVFFSVLLVFVSIGIWTLKIAGRTYLIGAGAAGTAFTLCSIAFLRVSRLEEPQGGINQNHYARLVFFGSLIYLPFIMLLMVFDKMG
jgi:protoheme IX farnesyltransferase